MTTIYVPKKDNFRGSDATGSDGGSNRVITLSQASTSTLQGMVVTVDGTTLVNTADYTFSSGSITFLNALWDNSYIEINYSYTTTTSVVSGPYCTTEQVTEYMGIDSSIPNYDDNAGADNNPEEIISASGANTTSTFYTNNTRVINDTYTFTYGASATATTQTELTETTHYTFDKDTGSFVLTTAGNTAVGSNGVYAVYKYIQKGAKYFDSVISDIIDRKTVQIDKLTDQSWQTTTLNIREEHAGRGAYDRIYRGRNQPVIFVSTRLDGGVNDSTTTFAVDDTTGFVVGDYITINDEVVLVDTITDSTNLEVTRAQYGTSAASHSDNDFLCNVVVETSNAIEGYTPSFQVLGYSDDFEIHSDTGAVQVLHINVDNSNVLGLDVYPAHHIFNRYRMTYRSGATSVPNDINNVCILMVAKELYNSQILNALSRGTDGFKSDGINDITDEIDNILKERRLILSSRG